MTRFLLMRHGLTEWNLDTRIQGRTDIALSDAGREQCAQWRKSLSAHVFQRILSSPLKRTVETAQLVAGHKGLPHDTAPGLMELDWGRWAGRDKQAMKRDKAAVKEQQNRGLDFRPPGGESRREMLERVLTCLGSYAETYPEETVLTVTHNGVLQVLSRHLSGLAFLPGEPNPLQSYRLHCMGWDAAGPKLIELNMDL